MTLLEELRRRFPYRSTETLLARVLCGEVVVDNERMLDPKARVALDLPIRFIRRRYVSRGGDKLEAALRELRIVPANRIFLDAGASTGGFTDCLLKHGAALVYAIDVGRNQLAHPLRQEPRVRVYDSTNVMDLERLEPTPSDAVCDLSFRTVHRAVLKLLDLTNGGQVLTLVKPQFELAARRGDRQQGDTSLSGAADNSFDGVVRDTALITEIFRTVVTELFTDGVAASAWLPSPVEGSKGNREAFFLFQPANRVEHPVTPGEIEVV